jgi:hypothetical protein
MMNTTVSTPARYIIEKFCIAVAGISRPESEQVPEWIVDANISNRREAVAYARPMQRRGKQVRVIDTATGEILDLDPAWTKHVVLHHESLELTPIPASVNGMPNGYAWAKAIRETRRQMLVA